MKILYSSQELQGFTNAQKVRFLYPLRVEVTTAHQQDTSVLVTFALLVGEDAIAEWTQEVDSIERLLDAFDIADHEELFELVSDDH